MLTFDFTDEKNEDADDVHMSLQGKDTLAALKELAHSLRESGEDGTFRLRALAERSLPDVLVPMTLEWGSPDGPLPTPRWAPEPNGAAFDFEVEFFDGYEDEDEIGFRWDGDDVIATYNACPKAYGERRRDDGLLEIEVVYTLELAYEDRSRSRGSSRN
jgi:hypothetical protein